MAGHRPQAWPAAGDHHPRLLPLVRAGFALAALLSVATLLIWPYLGPAGERLRLVATLPQADLGNDRDAIIDVTYTGIDAAGRAYGLVADLVRPLDEAKDRVALQAPKLDTVTGEGKPLSVVAASGTFDQRQQTIALAGRVRFELSGDYRLETEAAQLDLDAGTAAGASPVAASGPFGQLAAEGFRIEDDGNTLRFTGRSRLTIAGDAVRPPP